MYRNTFSSTGQQCICHCFLHPSPIEILIRILNQKHSLNSNLQNLIKVEYSEHSYCYSQHNFSRIIEDAKKVTERTCSADISRSTKHSSVTINYVRSNLYGIFI